MDFSLTVPEEWLQRRRSQVAEASRKIRAKKKREEEELRLENTKLREERTALLDKITELEKSLSSLTERDEDLENELLRTQLEQHKGFIRAFLDTIASIEPSETSSKGELAKQNRDFAWMHALRLISESQKDLKGTEWRSVEIPLDKFRLPARADYSVLYSKTRSQSTLHTRCDLVIPKVRAKVFRDLMSKYWHELGTYQSVFGKDKVMTATELSEFSVDDAEKCEKLRAYYCREPEGAKFRDTVFLTAIGETVLSKSTLQLPPGRGPVLSQSMTFQDINGNTSSSKRLKQQANQLTDPVEWGICGTANVYFGCRTVTGHGLNIANDDENVVRTMSTAIEVFMAWDEEIENLDPGLAGPCCRCIQVLSLPPDFSFPAIGNQCDFVDVNGKVGPRFIDAVRNFIQFAVNKLTGKPDD